MSMRSALLLLLVNAAACGEDAVNTPEVDTPAGNRPDPRVIPGGGIGDGAIDGVVNLYVIDETSRDPIAGAEVRVGTVTGLTGADGLFVAEGVVGPQDVVVKAPGHRKELWVGVNGANVTIDLETDLAATPASVTLSGTVLNFASVPFTVQPNHAKVALIQYSQTAKLGDPANEIATTANGNLCFADPCTFTINTRTGKLALLATILDFDTKGTDDDADDTIAVIGYAVRQGIDTASASSAQDLTVIADANLQLVAVDLGAPPSTLDQRGALVAIELGDEGVLPVGTFGAVSGKVPKLSALTGATGYRLTAFATDGAVAAAQSIALRRGLTGTTLSAGDWLAPPTGISLTRQAGSWTNASGATVHSIELSQGATRILNVTVFDSTRTSFDIPSSITLPSGPLSAVVNAFGATGFDVTSFSLDQDLDKIDRIGGQQTTIN